MPDKKYCPLKYTLKHGLEYCSEEKCAWWNSYRKECLIGTLVTVIEEAGDKGR